MQLFRIFNICDKYYKLKVGSNVTHGDGVHCNSNVRQMKWIGRIGFFVLRLQMQQREISRVFSVLKYETLVFEISDIRKADASVCLQKPSATH